MRQQITPEQYIAFQRAYDFFNEKLFAASLPAVLVTLQRHPKARGYFSPEAFTGRGTVEAAHELALNPDHFERTDEEILSTLVHEMVHVWQETHAEPSRWGYHNTQWAAKMKEVGLCPSHTGAPGGKETGRGISHYIIEGGAYAQAVATLKTTGFALRWQSRAANDREGRNGQGRNSQGRRKKAASKTKYTCPDCGLNAWAKPGIVLMCGECYAGDIENALCLNEEVIL